MSSSRSVSRSMHSTTSVAVANKLRPLSLSPSLFFSPSLRSNPHRPRKTRFFEPSTSLLNAQGEQLRTKFVDALVQAGSCRHEKRSPTTRIRDGAAIRQQSTMAVHKAEKKGKEQQAVNRERGAAQSRRIIQYSRNEYLSMLDYYRMDQLEESADDSISDASHKVSRDWAQKLGSDGGAFGMAEGTLEDRLADLKRVITDDASTPEDVFESYQRLPKPGILHLDREERIFLIRKLAVHRHRNSLRTLRFFSVIEDYKIAGITIPRHVWNSMIHLGSKTLFRIGEKEVATALKTWRQMEREAGIQSNISTFNILFDVAAKAGKFALAHMVVEEMEARGLEPDRFTRFGRIFAKGLQKDAQGVRRAYRDYVNAGELVDSAVLNCVIAALLNCGESGAAVGVFQRMRTLAVEREGKMYAPRSWEKQRELTKLLKWALHNNHSKVARDNLQSAVSVAPDIRTCNLLLTHYCISGELDRAVHILEEMQRLGIHPDNRTFKELMRGFAKHGGMSYTTWTPPRLEAVWRSFLMLLHGDHADLYITKWMVLSTLRAFHRCIGVKRELEIWEELKSRWKQDTAMEEIAPRPEGERSSWEVFKG